MTDAYPGINPRILQAFRSNLRGTTLAPRDLTYDAARRVWNGAIDRRPSAIILCADAEDVSLAVRIAADNGQPMTVREEATTSPAGRSVTASRYWTCPSYVTSR